MECTIPTKTLSDDLVHQQHHLKEAVSLFIHEDTDMVIVSKDKKLIPCRSSLLTLFSPVLARLLAGVTCCSSPTIFLPDFQSLYINKLLHLLRSGQAISGENVNIDVQMIKKIAEVLQISIIDLNLGPWLDNPLGVPFEIKNELSSFNLKKEINSFEGEKKVINLKQEPESENEKLESQPILVEPEEKEQYEYIEQDEDFESIVVGVELDPNGEVFSTGPVTGNAPQESSNDMDIREAEFEDDWYEQTEESENMILTRNKDDKNKIPKGEQDLTDQTNSSEDTDFQCFLCSINFTTSSQLRRHKKSHMDEKQFPRPVRLKMPSQMGSSNKLNKIHGEEEQLKRNPTSYKPDQGLCSSQKKCLRKNLNRDKIIHTQNQLHQCAFCSKSFSRLENLKQHKMIHTGEKPYQCAQCPKSFSQLIHLKRHKMTHTGEKPHQCDLCSKSFSRLGSLKLHKMTHTGEKPHQCAQCPKSFSRSAHLKTHKMTHTGEKPHQCVQCLKAFSQLVTLNRHKMIHTGEKLHQCVVCYKKFSRLDSLKAHKMVHTGEKT